MRHPIFDFDGTILDSLRDGPALFLKVAHALGLHCGSDKERQLRKQWGLPAEALVKECWPTANLLMFFEMLKVFETEKLHPLFPMMENLLTTLSGQDRMISILTSRQQESAIMHLKYHGIREFIRFCSAAEDAPKPKPDPASILPLLAWYASYGIHTSSLVIIGDSVHSDFGLASNLRIADIDIPFIAVTWGASTRDEFLKAGVSAEWIADSVERLMALLFSEL